MIKSLEYFRKDLVQNFSFSPTTKQNELFYLLSKFILENEKDSLFVLKGFAGTGKTTVISSFVNTLAKYRYKSILLAPTGRAAKVISVYSKRPASTIHRKIYFPKKNANGNLSFELKVNKHADTIFIVDEASMISDRNSSQNLFDSKSLLDDLISFVYSGKNCKLIFVGDTAQLPPIKLDVSPALDENTLSLDFQKSILTIELDEVMRQLSDSGILYNATQLRLAIDRKDLNFKYDINFPDIFHLQDSYDIEDALLDAFDSDTIEESVLIVRSNKRANQYNHQIRHRIRGHENEISTGDFIMIVKNNYYWLSDDSEAGFIANGDICEVLRILSIKDLYGFKFAEVELRMIDYPKMNSFETVLLLDTLTSESASLTFEEANKLYEAIKEDYADEKSKYKQYLAIKKNKYFNALQIKFSYAITCHKSQGGQWENVFIEQPYLPDGVSEPYYRWLYTAITRAKQRLFLIGFKDEYFKD